MTADSFFADIVNEPTGQVDRENGEPIIVAVAGLPADPWAEQPEPVRMTYTRASSLADFISDQRHIHRWEQRNLAKGMALSPDLCVLAAAEPYTTGLRKPPSGTPERRANAASGRNLDTIVFRALDRVGIHERADYGSAMHLWTEPGNGQPIIDVHNAQADALSFPAKLEELGIRIVATELFTVNDELRAAGTFDHLVWVPHFGWCIGDKKTGDMHPHEMPVQLSVYANGLLYDPITHVRTPLESLTGGEEINRDVGVIFQIRDGATRVWLVNLEHGIRGARLAAQVRDWQSETDLVTDAEPTIRRALRRADHRPALTAAAESPSVNSPTPVDDDLFADF